MEYAEMRRCQIVVRITTVLNGCQDDTVIISKPFFHQFGNRIQWFKLHIENSHPIRVFSVMVISLIMVIKMTALKVVNFTVLVLFLAKSQINNQSLDFWWFRIHDHHGHQDGQYGSLYSELIFLHENLYLSNHSRDYVDSKCITNDSCARA